MSGSGGVVMKTIGWVLAALVLCWSMPLVHAEPQAAAPATQPPAGSNGTQYIVLSITENGPGTVDVKLKNPRTGYVHSLTLVLDVVKELGLKALDRVWESRKG